MHLSKRLTVIANMIDNANLIYDVGCDHAHLDIFLAKKGFNCVAIDVRNNIIEKVKNSVKIQNLEDKIEVKLNNGLNDINIEDNDIVVLSGLGTKTILKIIKNKAVKRLIIQSNDNLYLLRLTMMNNNYCISDEKIVYEDGKYYIIIKFEAGHTKYSFFELLLGPCLLKEKNKIYISYLQMLHEHFKRVLEEIPSDYDKHRMEIKQVIDNIKMALD